MASSREGRRAPAEATEEARPTAVETNMEEPTTTKKMVTRRMSQAEVDNYIAYTAFADDGQTSDAGLPTKITEVMGVEALARLPQHLREKLIEIDASWARLKAELREGREEILSQYREKGFVEFQVEVDDDEGEEGGWGPPAPPAPRRGRRRFRPGVV